MADIPLPLALKLALKEFRSGTRGFWVFLLCLALGVAAIAAIGTVRSGLEQGLKDAGSRLLGGDAQIEFTYRLADDEERAWMADRAVTVSEVVEFRSMATAKHDSGTERALTQLKAVDDHYPLVGDIDLDPAIAIQVALGHQDGLPGAIMKPELARRLGLEIGDPFRLGLGEFRLSAHLVEEPDSTGSNFALGPRTIVYSDALESSGLLGPGTLFESEYRMLLPQGTELDDLRHEAESLFLDKGIRWQDSRDGAPGISNFIERVSSFLIIVGLAGLVIGGVGISLAISTYIDSKTETIATLKVLGASQVTVFTAYLIQCSALLLIGILAGLVAGITLPMVFQAILLDSLELPVLIGIYPEPVIESVSYGLLTGLIFTTWSLSRTARVRPSSLYRQKIEAGGILPPLPYLVMIAIMVAIFVFLAVRFSGTTMLTLYVALGTVGTLVVLYVMAQITRVLAKRCTHSRLTRGRPALRLALGAIGGPGPGTVPIILALGLGFTVLATIGQISTNLISRITGDLPTVAPEYFLIDIQNAQFDEYMEMVEDVPGVTRIDSSPMLRGIITHINGVRATEVAGDHWVLRGDRGVTYSNEPPDGTILTEGSWWPSGYSGEPQISFAAEEAEELNLQLGDRLTVNILGRDIEAVVTSFRSVDFSSIGIGFILAMNPSALANAPHTHISTIYGNAEIDHSIVDRVNEAFPNVTVISVREGIANFMRLLRGLISAITYAALATLAIGLIVVIGATAREVSSRIFEAAVLKTLGAGRRTILRSLALRSSVVGLVAGSIAVLVGSIGGFAVMRFVMESEYAFAPFPALVVIAGGLGVTLVAGVLLSRQPLYAHPATILRERE